MERCRGCGLTGVHATADDCIAALKRAIQQEKERNPIWWQQELARRRVEQAVQRHRVSVARWRARRRLRRAQAA